MFVDVAISTQRFPYVRCNYLSVERDEPDPTWRLEMGNRVMPFMLVHLSGIVFESFEGGRFTSPQLVEDLFTAVEGNEQMSLEVGDVWLPDFLLPHSPAPGAVFRMRQRLFLLAFAYRHGTLEEKLFVQYCREDQRSLEFSEEETTAFRIFHEQQVSVARELFPKNSNFVLYPRQRSR